MAISIPSSIYNNVFDQIAKQLNLNHPHCRWLQRGSMFVISYPQFLTLLNKETGWQADSLLDLGAGDGEVTACLAKSFRKVFATEVSSTMQNLLWKKGYT